MIRSAAHICILLMLLSGSAVVCAQGISATITGTTSICYNDGTLTVNASGGTGPYTDSILSGPAGVNLIYPIALPTGGNTFINLPHGTYTVKVTDAAGHSGTFTATVGGTYQYPVCTLHQSGPNSLICTVTPGTGRAPFQYAYSTAGPNSGFRPFQPADSFTGLCPATYWVRVVDSCGNIYTTSIALNYNLNYTLGCVSFSKGTLTVTGTGGHHPYTYSVAGQTNGTGIFTGLGAYFNGNLTITDSCGVVGHFTILPGGAGFKTICPFDSTIYLISYSPPTGLGTPATVTYICENCVPVQTITNPPANSPLFHPVRQGQTYNIEIITSSCGGDTTFTSYNPPPSPPGTIQITYSSCNSFTATVLSQGIPVNLADIDSFVLESNFTGGVVAVNRTGIFHHLPDSVYLLKVYASALACLGPTSALVVVPHLPSGCSYMMKDSACRSSWEFAIDSISPERYTMVYSPGDTVQGYRTRDGGQALINFYEVQAGTYTLISDSGCSTSLQFYGVPVVTSPSYSSISCIGTPLIFINESPQVFCNTVRAIFYYQDSMVIDTPLTTNVINNGLAVSDSGWYYYKVYALSYSGDSSLVRYDSICPIDSGSVYVGYGSLPYPYPAVLYECGDSGLPEYHIYGGETPYTIEIPGFDTVTINSNTGVFPTDSPGQYTVIAFDHCGISHSFSFTIIDTCTPVICATMHAGPDTTICGGQFVKLTASASQPGGAYSWSPGGATTASITVSPFDTAAYYVTYAQPHCPAVSDTVTVAVITAPVLTLDDTTICAGQRAMLTATPTASGGTYSWSPGGASTESITVSPLTTTTYTVTYLIAGCTPATDSSIVTVTGAPPTASVVAIGAICYSPDGMEIAMAGGGVAPYTYLWSDPAHTAADTLGGLYPNASYSVTVSDLNHCTATATGIVGDTIEPLDMADVVADISCPGLHDGRISLQVLNSSHCTFVWSGAAGDSVLSGLYAGSYSVTVTDPVGCTDTMSFTITQPPVYTLAVSPSDTTVNEGSPVVFNPVFSPSQPGGSISYDWTPALGLSCADCEYPTFNTTAGSYQYRLLVTLSGGCTLTDTVTVKVYSQHLIYVPDAFTPNGDGVNDVLLVFPKNARYLNMRVFDRWGEKVFETEDQAVGWDGSFRGTALSAGTYPYELSATFSDGYTVHDKGSITLIR